MKTLVSITLFLCFFTSYSQDVIVKVERVERSIVYSLQSGLVTDKECYFGDRVDGTIYKVGDSVELHNNNQNVGIFSSKKCLCVFKKYSSKPYFSSTTKKVALYLTLTLIVCAIVGWVVNEYTS